MAKRTNEIMMLRVVEGINKTIYGVYGQEVNVFVFMLPLCAKQNVLCVQIKIL